jgi:hypothetical protein
METISIDGTTGYTTSSFSQTFLDLQSTFCCNDKDIRKLIRWVGCKPSVFQSNVTLFTANDLALCSWFQEVTTYNFGTISIPSGSTASVDFTNLNPTYLLLKSAWPKNALESKKLLEIATQEQQGYVGSTIPFVIGGTGSTGEYQYKIIKDLYHINSNSELTGRILFNNISPYTVSVSVLYAN